MLSFGTINDLIGEVDLTFRSENIFLRLGVPKKMTLYCFGLFVWIFGKKISCAVLKCPTKSKFVA